MQHRKLGNTDIDVSVICLGTMTWGEQNTQTEAHAQLDAALDAGVNFIDTAEMYSIPPKAETYGRTETIIGEWLSARANRDKVILASKVAGPCGDWMPHVRDGRTRLDRVNIEAAIDASLMRLQTDYIDLYQVHWPDRPTNYFGRLGYTPKDDPQAIAIEDTLTVLGELVAAGKIRYVGVSNETPWGVMRYLRTAETLGLPRIVSVQNPYNLLNRSYEVGLAEIADREQVGLLAYSPLGFGVLSGKYAGGARPAGARLTLYPDYQRYLTETGIEATTAYLDLARRHNLKPAQMALAYVNSRPFLTSNIIGATSLDQLQENLATGDMELADTVLDEIEAIHRRYPYPCP